ncbi:MAG: type VI secretion protein [Candidatus Fimivivens sp.]
MDNKAMLRKMRAAEFSANNGRVLRTINILRHRFERLSGVKAALDEIPEVDFLDCINFLADEGYITLRTVSGHQDAALSDAEDYRDLEAKVTAKGIRLLGGEIIDKMVLA